jgi:hypothetical protein
VRAQGDNPIYVRLTQGTERAPGRARYMSTGEDSLSGWVETNSQKFTCGEAPSRLTRLSLKALHLLAPIFLGEFRAVSGP